MKFKITWPIQQENDIVCKVGAISIVGETRIKKLFPEANIPKLFKNFNLTNLTMTTSRGGQILVTKEAP